METPPDNSFLRSRLHHRTPRSHRVRSLTGQSAASTAEFELHRARGRYRSRLARSESDSDAELSESEVEQDSAEERERGGVEDESAFSAAAGPPRRTPQRLWTTTSQSERESDAEPSERDIEEEEDDDDIESALRLFSSSRIRSSLSRSRSLTQNAQRERIQSTLAQWNDAFDSNNAALLALSRETLALQQIDRERMCLAMQDTPEVVGEEEGEDVVGKKERERERQQERELELLRKAREGDSEIVFAAQLQSLRALTKELRDTDWMFTPHQF